MSKHLPQIALLIESSRNYGRGVLHGIARYAHAHGPWSFAIEARSVIVSGGVACNDGLRLAAQSADLDCPVHFPSRALSTDNAVMIAAAAFPKLRRGEFSGLTVPAYASLPLA